ncbi:MaoC/PaaZ C-terminal domain-containing protein [Skermania piniformis]|uniref:MaoC family dehydratase N-terminal domain-containing protein n=1 Tax=Skermania pinensis TaxID=39122 RepID=A0ABX8SAK3_9ACTN|nr:MaoC/PaaZ C-terminal domain-containing protein [Skermania piniformis]QXQ13580.1 MaoC family dehydratase N-terminal domain-containing protein [Skermania piniformis]
MADHVFDTAVLDQWGETITFPVDLERSVDYAKATNDPIAQHLDGTLAPPVFAVVPAIASLAETTMSAVPDELMLRILHGEQDFRFYRPIVPGDVLKVRCKVVGIHGKSSGVVVTSLAETRDEAGELVNEQYFTGFFKGGQWPHEVGALAPEHTFDEQLRSRSADFVMEQKFDEDQTFRYAEPAGDPMPIHLDDEFAKSMGLPGIIMHGLCTMAFTSHAVLNQVAPGNPERLKRLAVRFATPGRPGQVMTTSIWDTGNGTLRFESLSNEGQILIKDGLAEVEGA